MSCVFFYWRDVFLDVATTSDEHADEADWHRNYAVRMWGPHPSHGKWQWTKHFYLFSVMSDLDITGFGAHRSRVSCTKGTPLWVKRTGREADHSPVPSTNANNECSYNFTPHIWLLDVHRNYCTALWPCGTWSMLNNMQKKIDFSYGIYFKDNNYSMYK